jgi:uncharacterized protein (DUF1697 family)
MPTNARMPELKRCFEEVGFLEVRTLLGSGNVVFTARTAAPDVLARRAERAMQAGIGRSFQTIVRSGSYLRELLDSDPFAEFALPATTKCVITFLRGPVERSVSLPIEREGARILKVAGGEVFSAYERTAKGPVFMTLLERTFGKDITTRTLDTVRKCAAA